MLDKFIKVCEQSRQGTNALLEIQCAAFSYEAYTTICSNLGITPIMDNYSYQCARPDLAARHLKALFLAWATTGGMKDLTITIKSDGKDYIAFHTGSLPVLYFIAPAEEGVINQSERVAKVILKFSVMWALL